MQGHQSRWRSSGQWLCVQAPGLLLALTAAAASSFLASLSNISVLLVALLIGISLNFLASDDRVLPGLSFASRPVLQVGVALLGLGISLAQVVALGSDTLLLVLGGVLAAIGSGWLFARLFDHSTSFGVLSGGAVGICGASAALAISSALPPDEARERETTFVIIVVTALSTLAMVVYPLLAHWLGFNDRAAGIMIGATIHDVAQVVGAGYAISDEAGDTATVVKLFRVVLLLPTVFIISLAGARAGPAQRRLLLPVPLFAIGFAALAIINSLTEIPQTILMLLGNLSRGCLIVAVAAIGIKTSLRGILRMGTTALAIPVGSTIVLLVLVLAVLMLRGI